MALCLHLYAGFSCRGTNSLFTEYSKPNQMWIIQPSWNNRNQTVIWDVFWVGTMRRGVYVLYCCRLPGGIWYALVLCYPCFLWVLTVIVWMFMDMSSGVTAVNSNRVTVEHQQSFLKERDSTLTTYSTTTVFQWLPFSITSITSKVLVALLAKPQNLS